MSKMQFIFDPGNSLPEKLATAIRVHDSHFLGSVTLDSPQTLGVQELTVNRILQHVQAFIKSMQPKKNSDCVVVIGKPKNYYLYINVPFIEAVKRYRESENLSPTLFLQDDTIETYRVCGSHFRCAELYKISDSDHVEQLEKESGVRMAWTNFDKE